LANGGTIAIYSSPCTGPYIGAVAVGGAALVVIGKIVANNQEYYDQAGIQLQVEIKRGISQWQEYTVPTAMDPVVSGPIEMGDKTNKSRKKSSRIENLTPAEQAKERQWIKDHKNSKKPEERKKARKMDDEYRTHDKATGDRNSHYSNSSKPGK
jgi:hypothetical protein